MENSGAHLCVSQVLSGDTEQLAGDVTHGWGICAGMLTRESLMGRWPHRPGVNPPREEASTDGQALRPRSPELGRREMQEESLRKAR